MRIDKKSRLIIITVIVICFAAALFYILNRRTLAINAGMRSDSRIGYTSAIPDSYFEECSQQGTVVRLEYESQDYTSDSAEKIMKPVYVYLPYGYDENDEDTKYNIFYMMHWWGGVAEYFLHAQNGAAKAVLDNMIANGDMEPVIVVCPTFDSENRPQNFDRSYAEVNVFHQDFRNDLLPFIESRYHTYAADTSEEGFKESRDHRAFGGFSIGSVTTWYEFIYDLDYIRYFMPMSLDCWILGNNAGLDHPKETSDYLAESVKISEYDVNDFLIYAATGTSDVAFNHVNNQLQEMLKNEVFQEGNLYYRLKEGGKHDFDGWLEYVYNGLPYFFQD